MLEKRKKAYFINSTLLLLYARNTHMHKQDLHGEIRARGLPLKTVPSAVRFGALLTGISVVTRR